MSPTPLFSQTGDKIPKTGQVSFPNGPDCCQNPQIDAFRAGMATGRGRGAMPPKKRFYLQNLDGRAAQGTEKELLTATGLSRQLFYQLKTGRTEYARHWKIVLYEENGLKKVVQPRASKRKYIIFYQPKGRILKRTRIEFIRLTGLDRNLVYGRIKKRLPIPGWNYLIK